MSFAGSVSHSASSSDVSDAESTVGGGFDNNNNRSLYDVRFEDQTGFGAETGNNNNNNAQQRNQGERRLERKQLKKDRRKIPENEAKQILKWVITTQIGLSLLVVFIVFAILALKNPPFVRNADKGCTSWKKTVLASFLVGVASFALPEFIMFSYKLTHKLNK